jgi:hypothetical protein
LASKYGSLKYKMYAKTARIMEYLLSSHWEVEMIG